MIDTSGVVLHSIYPFVYNTHLIDSPVHMKQFLIDNKTKCVPIIRDSIWIYEKYLLYLELKDDC